MNTKIDIAYARQQTDMADFLYYLTSVYGEQLYTEKIRLKNLIAELYGGEEKIKRLYSRAIMEDGLSQRIYALLQKSMNERQPLLDAIACRFAENNFLSEKIGKKVTNAFAEGITLFGVLSTQVGESDGEWVDKYGVKYSADRRKLIWCTNWDLEDYSILNGVQVICDSAFYDCSSLQSIHIPNSVKSIGNNVFEACSSLRSIHIPNSVKSIGDNAFLDCSMLNIDVDVNNSNYISIEGGIYSKNKKILIRGNAKEDFVIPFGVTHIEEYAFSGCSTLQSIHIPNSVTSIGNNAFSGCSSLQSINIPNSVESIGDHAFSECSTLQSINIPNSVTSIGGNAFSGCSFLQNINILNNMMDIGIDAFHKCTSLQSIHIPQNSLSKFKKLIPYYLHTLLKEND